MASIEDARRVKARVKTTFGSEVPIVGVGLTKVGAEPAVKVNLGAPFEGLPERLEGVSIVYEVVGPISKRSS
ncbi:hypothetical protein [Phenylobacterium kunshanense]|uniref:Uncharacterized protein n=1 Tax=Phenylobacterium kunshanense TaxID=1445034 RepID=A0A328B7L0_9CAUL|nr:hypothetical protein [Phenylobacterium kunshanense]RAK63410.1 hypothetical protein DJ019_16955 [Phenylobacterium kunshanense]